MDKKFIFKNGFEKLKCYLIVNIIVINIDKLLLYYNKNINYDKWIIFIILYIF